MRRCHALESRRAIACIRSQCQQHRLCLGSVESVGLRTLCAVHECCVKQSSLRGYPCMEEKRGTFKDTYHLQEGLCTWLAVPQLEASSASGPCLAHHQAAASVQGPMLTWNQPLPTALAVAITTDPSVCSLLWNFILSWKVWELNPRNFWV